MSEAGDYQPAKWTKKHDFGKARATYKKTINRSYSDTQKSPAVSKKNILASMTTDAENPMVIAVDVTGSMSSWPTTIFSKLPYLEHEGKEYLGDDMEISFAAVADVLYDSCPVQYQPFCSGEDLVSNLEKLVKHVTIGGGGCNQIESYDLPALYYANNVEMPNAIKPVFIFVGDEGIIEWINKSDAKTWAKHDIGKPRIKGIDAIRKLKDKYSVYIVRKAYGYNDGNKRNHQDARIQRQWESVLGEDHVCELADPDRVVDVIFGILANETGRIDYFEDEIEERQCEKDKNGKLKDPDGPKKVKVVLESLVSIHTSKHVPESDNDLSVSVTSKKTGKEAKSISLMDE